jgi:hypothetical protein
MDRYDNGMPAKKSPLSDAERAKRIREIAHENETSNDLKGFCARVREKW